MLEQKVFAYYRSWHVPFIPGYTEEHKDMWLLSPASVTQAQGATYTTMPNMDAVLMADIIINQDGTLLRGKRLRPGLQVSPELMQALASTALDVSAFIEDHGHWNWNAMFDKKMIHDRFTKTHGQDRSKFYQAEPTDSIYRQIIAQLKPRPCGCQK